MQRIALIGFGNVGQFAAKLLIELGGVVVAVSSDGRVMLADLATGTVLWSADLGAAMSASAAVADA